LSQKALKWSQITMITSAQKLDKQPKNTSHCAIVHPQNMLPYNVPNMNSDPYL